MREQGDDILLLCLQEKKLDNHKPPSFSWDEGIWITLTFRMVFNMINTRGCGGIIIGNVIRNGLDSVHITVASRRHRQHKVRIVIFFGKENLRRKVVKWSCETNATSPLFIQGLSRKGRLKGNLLAK